MFFVPTKKLSKYMIYNSFILKKTRIIKCYKLGINLWPVLLYKPRKKNQLNRIQRTPENDLQRDTNFDTT